MAISESTDRFFGVVSSLAIKVPCVAVAESNITLSGEQTVGGVAVVAGDRVLVIGQTASKDNGIYDASTSAWIRSADFDGNRDIVSGTFVTVATATVGRNPYYQVTTANPITIGTTAINFTLADGANVSFDLTTAEIAASLTDDDIDKTIKPGHVVRYGTNTSPGITDLITAVQNCALVDDGRVIFPNESVLVSAATPLLSNTIVSGGGYVSHIVTATVNQTAIFSAADKTNIIIENIRLEGDDTASAVTNGVGIYFTDCDDCLIDRCWFTLFGGACIRIQGDDAAGHDNFKVNDCFFFANAGRVAAAEDAEIYVAGDIHDFAVDRCRFEADASNAYQRGILVANNGATLNWSDVTITKSYFDGYAGNAIGTTDENPSGTFDNGIVKITGCTIKNCTESGIKTKNSWRVIITGNYLENNDTTPEIAGNLQGSIFVNAAQHCSVTNNIIIDAGTDGIRTIGLNTASGGTAAGAGRSSFDISHNIIENPGEAGVYVNNDTFDSNIDSNIIRNAGGPGIRFAPATATPALGLSVSLNSIRGTDAASNAAGIVIDETDQLTLVGNRIKLCDGFGIVITNSNDVSITGGMIMDNGVGNTNTAGIRISTTNDVVITGVRAGNDTGTDQDHALSCTSSVVGLVVVGNNFAGNQIAAATGIPDTAIVSNNVGLMGNMVTFGSADATPSVLNGSTFLSNATGVTITRFDDGVVGQEITIISKGATVYDTSTATRLIGSTVDITTASGDITTWICETGGTSSSVWRLKGFVDVSVDNSAGA